MEQITFLDLLSQETKRDPISFAARLREQGPLIHLPGLPGMGGAWIVTAYDDATGLLKDPRFIKNVQKLSPPDNEQNTTGEHASMLRQSSRFDGIC